MARSPSDATRFTATGPYVSSKPGATSFNSNPLAAPPTKGSRVHIAGAVPTNETAQQKIARLRAAALAAKKGQETGADRMVRIGRTVADKAHRYTALGLIGFTILSGMVATAGITDMLLHNRRRRNEWLAEKQAETARELAAATTALKAGSATEDQMLLINRERAAIEAAEARKNKPGVFKRTTNWLFKGAEMEEQKGGRLGVSSTSALLEQTGDRVQGAVDVLEHKVGAQRRQGEQIEQIIHPRGGLLDQQAELIVQSASEATRSWTKWITGRS